MDQRGEPRIDVEQTVRLTTLGENSEEHSAQIANLSGTGMRLLVDRQFPPGVALRIEWDQFLLLGEVCYCQSVDGRYAIGVDLEHALLHTRDLARLARELLGDVDPSWNGHPQAVRVRKLPAR